LRH
ncbi:hypothetical protein BN1708_016883, partial [Verticillium longisporum]|jgi:hypothetical protein